MQMPIRIGLAILLLVVPGWLAAQQTTGRVNGTVTDADGNPIEGVRVSFVSPSLQGERVTTTDARGRYLAALLPTGPYAATFSAPGMKSSQVSFRLQLGEIFPLDIRLEAGEDLVEEVTVYGTTSKLETTTEGLTLGYQKEVEELPIQGRDLEDVALYAPNVGFGPTGSDRRGNPSLAIAGALSQDTLVLLDGSEVSDPLFGSGTVVYFEDAIKEIQVLTSGISARYGRFQGGVLNAITKGGSNDYHATLRYEFANQDWNGKTDFGETQSDDLDERYWATVAGRIVRDRLWFFAGYRTIPETMTSSTTVRTQESFETSANEDRWEIRLTGNVNPDHVIDVTRLEFDGETTNRAGLTPGESRATGDRDDPRDMTTATYQGVLTPNLFIEGRLSEKNAAISSGGDPALGSPIVDWSSGIVIYNNHWWDRTDLTERNNQTGAVNLTQVIDNSLGNHTLEYGIQYVNSETGGDNRQSATGLNFISFDSLFIQDVNNPGVSAGFPTPSADIRFAVRSVASGADNRRLRALDLGGAQEVEDIALYVQDSLQLDENWRVDAGLRFETYESTSPMPTQNVDYEAIAPRVGVTRNIGEDWQVQLNYGEYVGRLNDNWVQDTTGVGAAPGVESQYTGPDLGQLTRAEVEMLLNDTLPVCAGQPGGTCWGTALDVVDPSQPTSFVASDLESPRGRDFNFNVRRALPDNTGSVVLQYTRRDYDGLVDDFVGNGATNLTPVTVTDPFGSGNTFPADVTIWDNNGEALRRYEAFTASVDYRPSSVWWIQGNYTLSETWGNYEGEQENQPGNGSPLGDYPTTRPDDLAAPVGYLDEDVKHRVNILSTYRFDFGRSGALVLGGAAQYNSGRAFSLMATVPRDGDGNNCCAPSSFTGFFDGRGSRRFEGRFNLDLSARYQVQLWRDLDFWFKVNVTNITNESAQIGADIRGTSVLNAGGNFFQFDPSANFGNPENEFDFQRPRTLLFTAGLDW